MCKKAPQHSDLFSLTTSCLPPYIFSHMFSSIWKTPYSMFIPKKKENKTIK